MPIFSTIFALLIINAPSFQAETWITKKSYDPVNTYTDYYEAGLRELEDGNWKEALNIWLEGYNTLSSQEVYDPRISSSFIELATAKKQDGLYKTACAIYFWGLGGGEQIIKKYSDLFHDEIERLRPLLSEDEYNRWIKILRNEDPSILNQIKGFWIQLDPTPATYFNERLIEHWERIAYIKKNFKINRSTVYNSDDRGLIYIKYGSPDFKNSGIFHFDALDVQAWAQDAIAINNSSSFNLQRDTLSNLNSDLGTDIRQRTLLANWLSETARQLHRNPRYEIWVYKNLIDDKYNNVIYIFGDDGDTGFFGLRKSLEEMIPQRALSLRGRRIGTSITPGLLLELMLYDQASHVDLFFSDALYELESKVFSNYGVTPSISYQTKSRNEFKLGNIHAKAPHQNSSVLKNLPNIDIQLKQYRLLSEKNEPYIATLILSHAHEALLKDFVTQGMTNFSNYNLRHTVQLRDKNWNIISVFSDDPQILVNTDSTTQNAFIPSQSLFNIPFISTSTTQCVAAELYNFTQPGKSDISLLPKQLRGVGKMQLQQSVPLNTDSGKLEMADVILGHNKTEKGMDIPFIISPDNRIPLNQDLAIHIELYHLQPKANGIVNFTIEYEIKRGKIGFLNKLFKKDTDKSVTLTLNFNTEKPLFKDNIEIETSALALGQYELILKVTDLFNNQSIEKVIPFEIITL